MRIIALPLLLSACNQDGKDSEIEDTSTLTYTTPTTEETTPTDTTTDGGTLTDYLEMDVIGTIIVGTDTRPEFSAGCLTYDVEDTDIVTRYYEVTDNPDTTVEPCLVTTVGADYYMELHIDADSGAYHFYEGVFGYEIDPRYGADWAGIFFTEEFATE